MLQKFRLNEQDSLSENCQRQYSEKDWHNLWIEIAPKVRLQQDDEKYLFLRSPIKSQTEYTEHVESEMICVLRELPTTSDQFLLQGLVVERAHLLTNYTGEFDTKDKCDEEARRLFQIAYDMGHPRSLFHLGCSFAFSKPKQLDTAKKLWLEGATKYEDYRCLFQLGYTTKYQINDGEYSREQATFMRRAYDAGYESIHYLIQAIARATPDYLVPYGQWKPKIHEWVRDYAPIMNDEMKTFLLICRRNKIVRDIRLYILGFVCTFPRTLDYKTGKFHMALHL